MVNGTPCEGKPCSTCVRISAKLNLYSQLIALRICIYCTCTCLYTYQFVVLYWVWVSFFTFFMTISYVVCYTHAFSCRCLSIPHCLCKVYLFPHSLHHKAQRGKLAGTVADELIAQHTGKHLLQSHGLEPGEGTP